MRSTAKSLIVFGVATAAMSQVARADGVGTVAYEVGKDVVVSEVKKVWHSMTTEHTRFHPQGNECIIPMKDLGGTRVSFNFHHQAWVPRGSALRRVRITFHGFDPDALGRIRVIMMADKPKRPDRASSAILSEGSEFELRYGTNGDRAYFFVERNGFTGSMIPAGAYIKLELLP